MSLAHPGGTVGVHVSDDTFVATAPQLVAAVVADEARWPLWWPDLSLRTLRDRGPKGRQWVLSGTPGGTAEIYLEPWADGTLVHLFLRLEVPLTGRAAPGRTAGRERERRALAWKRSVTALKDELEAGRAVGGPAIEG